MRQVKEPAAVVAQGLCRLLVPLCGQVVEDDNGPGSDLRDKHVSDVGGKGGAIHGTLDDPWCDQSIRGQLRDQGLDPQLPNGAPIVSRSPRLTLPRSRVRFVFTAVSSMKTPRSVKDAMAGKRYLSQSARC